MKSLSPDRLIYSEPGLAPGGAGPKPVAPELPPVGLGLYRARRRSAATPGFGQPPAVAPGRLRPTTCRPIRRPRCTRGRPCHGPSSLPALLLPAEAPPRRTGHRRDRAATVGAGRSASACALALAGCGFSGVNSLPLPGAVGRGSDASVYHLQFANIGTLESNSPVLIDDVVVGSVGKMTFSNWHIDVDVSVRPDVVVPANAVASVGQTSLLGSMHVALDPPLGQAPRGRLAARRHHRGRQDLDLPLDRADAVVAVGRRHRRRAWPDRRHHPQSRRRPVRARRATSVTCSPGSTPSSDTLDRQRDNIVASITALEQARRHLRRPA